jgi:tetratricopeptide (TPR) repeat protein
MRLAATTLALLLLAPVARGQSREEIERAKASFQAGATAYSAGEYLAAIQAFEAAHALTPVPAIAFSLAQAQRRQYFVAHAREHLDRAIALYRQYLQEVPTGGRRADALEALSQLEPLALTQGTAAARPTGTEAAAPRPTRLMITSEAAGARLTLDGGPPGPSPLIREVEPGQHRVAVDAEGFFPAAREVVAVAGELIPVSVPLRERPSTVVLATAADAEIYVDGTFASRGGAVTLSLPSGPHRLVVARTGYRVAARTVSLAPGKSQEVPLVLEPTGQRRAARLLFVASGAALATSLVFGALAVSAEDRAKEVLVRGHDANITRADLARYSDALEHRGRYRAASAGMLGVAAAGLAVALSLYQFDRPLTPVASPDSFALILGGRF